MQDTSDVARMRYFELLRRQTPARKLRTVVALNAAARRMALAGISEQHPNASPSEHRALLGLRLYGARGAAIFEARFSSK